MNNLTVAGVIITLLPIVGAIILIWVVIKLLRKP